MKAPMKSIVRRQAQKGVILIITLIAMVALAIASIAMLRSVGVGNVISGNMAFRQATLQAGDIGVEAAFNALPTIVNTSLDANIANQYYATRQNADSKGVPTGVNWASVPCRNASGSVVACGAQAYQVKYVIDRLCDGVLPITNVSNNCYTAKSSAASQQGGSKKAGASVFSKDEGIYYRITVQVTGPRNTQSYVQAIVSRG